MKNKSLSETIDFIEYRPSTKILTVSRNPYQFIGVNTIMYIRVLKQIMVMKQMIMKC